VFLGVFIGVFLGVFSPHVFPYANVGCLKVNGRTRLDVSFET